MYQKLIELTRDINENTAPEISYYLGSEEGHIDLIKLYFDDPNSFRIIKNNILQFISQNKSAYNLAGDGLTDFIVNTLNTFGLLDNLLFKDQDLEINKQFLQNHQDLWKNIIQDQNNGLDTKVKLELILNYFINISILNLGDINIEQFFTDLKISENNSILYYFLIGKDNYLERFLITNLEKFIISNQIKDYLLGIIISRLLISTSGLFEKFIISNLKILDRNQVVKLIDRDFNLSVQVLIAPFALDEKKKYLTELEYQSKSLFEIVKNNFKLENIAGGMHKEIIENLYNNNWEINVYKLDLQLSDLKFNNYDIIYKFIKGNISNYENLEPKFLLQLLIDSINFDNSQIYLNIQKNIKVFEKIQDQIDIKLFINNFNKLDLLISQFTDQEFRKKFYQQLYQTHKFVGKNILQNLDEKALQEILIFNQDSQIEKYILNLISTKQDKTQFLNLYINNLLNENTFTKGNYMFPYAQIIEDIGRGQEELQVISNILNSTVFIMQDPLKIGDFVEFLIQHQKTKYSQLKIIEYFFEIKNKIKAEFFDIVCKNILVTYLSKRNLVAEFIEQINQQINSYLPQTETGVFSKIYNFFHTKDDMENLREIKQNENLANQIENKNKLLLTHTLQEIGEIENFLNKYQQYLQELNFDVLRQDLLTSKARIENILPH